MKKALKREHYHLPTINDTLPGLTNAKYFIKFNAKTSLSLLPDPDKIDAANKL